MVAPLDRTRYIVPSSWLEQVQAHTLAHASDAERLARALDHELRSATPSQIPTEVAVADWSRKAVHRLASKELRVRLAAQADTVQLVPGVHAALEAVRMHAETTAACMDEPSARHQHLSFQELLEQRGREAAATVPFGPQKAATKALIESAKLRAIAAEMLQRPGSYRVCTEVDWQRQAQRPQPEGSQGGWEQQPSLPTLLMQADITSTLCVLVRTHLGASGKSDLEHTNDSPGGGVGSQNAGQPAQGNPTSTSGAVEDGVSGMLKRLKPTDTAVQALLQRSQGLRQQAARMGVAP